LSYERNHCSILQSEPRGAYQRPAADPAGSRASY